MSQNNALAELKMALALYSDWFVANDAMGKMASNINSRTYFTKAAMDAKSAYVTLYLDTFVLLEGKGVDLEGEGLPDPALGDSIDLEFYQSYKKYSKLLFEKGILTVETLKRAQELLFRLEREEE